VLLSIYAPDLLSAQEEYLSAQRLGDSSLVAAARRRLVLWNVPEDQIAMLDRTGQAQRTLVLRAPRAGEIAEKMVTDGQAVHAGDNLFLIADRRRLWVDLAVFEMDARMVRVGTPVSIIVDVLRGRTYRGRVTFIYPTVDEKTRTLTARAEVENDDGALRPGMYAMAELAPSGRQTLTVPTGAVLPTGTENLVFVNRGDGSFTPRPVTVGTRTDSLVEVIKGLKPGDEVVASATYLLDSESNLAAAMQGLMLQMGMGLNMGGMQMGGAQHAESLPAGRPRP
jgi:Cu(I)/Ag(I) efflux system membrane fusion protein